MIDPFDYLEPSCPLCGGEDFYFPKADAPLGQIPVARVMEKLDACLMRNDTAGAQRLLEYWLQEAKTLRDMAGELSVLNELVGHFRKTGQKEKALEGTGRALEMVAQLDMEENPSGATVLLNCATVYKAFGMPSEAVDLYEKTLTVYQNTLPAGDERFGGLYNNMALALEDLGRFDQAQEMYLHAVEVMEKTENGASEVAITYINLAHMYEKMGETDLIRPCLDKAYELLTSGGVPRDGKLAFVLEKCGPSFGYFGQAEVARRFAEEAKNIYAGA